MNIREALQAAQQARFQGRQNIRDYSIGAVSKAASMMGKGSIGGAIAGLGTKIAIRSGLADKLTGGRFTRTLTNIFTAFRLNKGIKSEYGNNVSQVTGQIGQSTKSVVNVLNKNV